MSHENEVHGMWIGELGRLEKQTIKSFCENGSTFNLWTYEKPKYKMSPKVVLRDANEIIPIEKIFKYPKNMRYGFCGETYVGFSELFRYKVLYEYGGWWSDMDVTCLKPITDIKEPYWFRFHGVLPVVGNIMKCPPKSELMLSCYETALEEINQSTDDMFQAIEILCYYVRFYKLRRFITKDSSNLDSFWTMEKYFFGDEKFPEEWHFVHWMRSAMNQSHFENKSSTFHKLLHCTTSRIL
jgi:hypothetical protein